MFRKCQRYLLARILEVSSREKIKVGVPETVEDSHFIYFTRRTKNMREKHEVKFIQELFALFFTYIFLNIFCFFLHSISICLNFA